MRCRGVGSLLAEKAAGEQEHGTRRALAAPKDACSAISDILMEA